MMTREEVLAEMEVSFAEMPEDIKTMILYTEEGCDWTPALLLEEVRSNTEYGNMYAQSWAEAKQKRADLNDLEKLLTSILDDGGMTCGDPDCHNCHGEVRPFDQG